MTKNNKMKTEKQIRKEILTLQTCVNNLIVEELNEPSGAYYQIMFLENEIRTLKWVLG